MKAHIAKQKKSRLAMKLAGAKGELVEDVTEAKPEVFTVVIKNNDFDNTKQGNFNYSFRAPTTCRRRAT